MAVANRVKLQGPCSENPARPLLRIGRRRPYTAAGIRRVPCARCGGPAEHSWQCCANGRRHVPICLPCDVALNDLVLQWLGHPHRAELMKRYRAAQR